MVQGAIKCAERGMHMKKTLQRVGVAVFSAILLLGCFGSAGALDITTAQGATQVRIPLILMLSRSIAGAEFAIEVSGGITSVRLERSAAINSATLTPVVEKSGKTYFGFFSGGNNYTPDANGQLDVGYLVLGYSGGAQSVTITETRTI